MITEKSLRLFTIVITFFSLLIATILYYGSVWESALFYSVLIGSALMIINFLLGYFFIKFGLNKSDKIFIMTLWGGMAFRLIFTLILVFIMLKFLELNPFGFIFSILFFYVFYLIIEILYLNLKKTEHFER
jgi:hypothetical protein